MIRFLLAHDLFQKPGPTFRDHVLAADRHFILLVADVLHPGDVFAVERLLGGDMNHARRRRGAVPVLFVWRNQDDVASLISRTFPPQLCTRPAPETTNSV